jgi:PKD repeat protein
MRVRCPGAFASPRAAAPVLLLVAAAGLLLLPGVLPLGVSGAPAPAGRFVTDSAPSNCTAPASVVMPLKDPVGSLAAGSTIQATYELKIVNPPSPGATLEVHLPRITAEFDLVNGTLYQISIAPHVLTSVGGAWTPPGNDTATKTVQSAISFEPGGGALLTSALIAVMANTLAFTGENLSVRWSWNVSSPNGTVFSGWAVNEWYKSCPSDFAPAPYVDLVQYWNATAPPLSNFTAALSGFVPGQYFFLELENPSGDVVYSQATTVPANATTPYNVSMTLTSWGPPILPGPYLAHIHNVAGSLLYSISVIVTAADGMTVNLTATPLEGFPPLTVNFTEHVHGGTAPYQYSWSFGDGSPAVTSPSPTHTFLHIGVYRTNLSVTDANRSLTTDSVAIRVNPPPPFNVEATCFPTVGAPPLTVECTSNVTGGIRPYVYNWSFGNGVHSLLADPAAVTYQHDGNFTVMLTASDAANSTDVSSVPVTVVTNASSLAVSVAADPTNGPAPLAVHFTATVHGGTGSYAVDWDFGDGTNGSYGLAVNHTFLATGNYSVRVSASDALHRAGTAVIAIAVGGGFGLRVSVSPSSITLGGTTYANATVSGSVGNVSYNWSVNGVPASTHGATLLLDPSAVGSYTIVVVAVTPAGVRESASASLLVIPPASGPGGGSPNPTLHPAPVWEWVVLGVAIAAIAAGIAFALRRLGRGARQQRASAARSPPTGGVGN